MDFITTSILGSQTAANRGRTFRAVNAATGAALEPEFHAASNDDVEKAASLATKAFATYGTLDATHRARFLRSIADKMDAAKDAISARAGLETGLPPARLGGELARTTGQLRMFAQLIEDGSWVEARLGRADAERKPQPKPDLRSMLIPLGPVAVFGASNFPLAYSVAGGDTASALAAGCPVVVKAHPAHPGTSAIVGAIIREAARETSMPEGVFSMLYDDGIEIGVELVKNPHIKAVGFTGSRGGGRALMDAAAARPEPIPVYAEMSSVNPLFLLASSLENRDALVEGLAASISNGVGQFCTKPGLIFVPVGAQGDEFIQTLGENLSAVAALPMLTIGIGENYGKGVTQWQNDDKVETIIAPDLDDPQRAHAALFQTSVRELIANRALMDEVFGPAALVIRFDDDAQAREAAHTLEGQLTFSIWGKPGEIGASGLVPIAAQKAGRVVFNGFPTGVEVGDAIIHGGPYPATSDGRTTSVGTRAIARWARYVNYQNAPQDLLPLALRDDNPLGIARSIDGGKPTAENASN